MGEEDIRELIERYHEEEFSKKSEQEFLEEIEAYYGITRLERWILYGLLLALTIVEAIKMIIEVIGM